MSNPLAEGPTTCSNCGQPAELKGVGNPSWELYEDCRYCGRLEAVGPWGEEEEYDEDADDNWDDPDLDSFIPAETPARLRSRQKNDDGPDSPTITGN